ncbi:gastric inhibitory polypeptide receptor isoform X2 [Hyperolius riggenbachi]|uniref:gastric inhibitory polypeptide receptor isoform X2 n=1 Tax=Hyperolius riggenbachi TaxID=752182 RepID=UPI0035A2C130
MAGYKDRKLNQSEGWKISLTRRDKLGLSSMEKNRQLRAMRRPQLRAGGELNNESAAKHTGREDSGKAAVTAGLRGATLLQATPVCVGDRFSCHGIGGTSWSARVCSDSNETLPCLEGEDDSSRGQEMDDVQREETEGGAGAGTVHETVQAWKRYQDWCENRIRTEPPMSGVYCNRTFDMYVCWGDAAANTTHQERCPSYLPWFAQVKDKFVYRQCGPDGQWVQDETNMPWRDHSECEIVDPEQEQDPQQTWILSQLQVMYSVGYGISLAALIVALCILTQLRRLRCTRNLIHCNLFVSFILRAVSLLSRNALSTPQQTKFQGEEDLNALLRERTLVWCRIAQTITQYCVAANYYWLLVEGLYLHNLLVVLSFSEEAALPRYMALGWGAPLLFVIPWVVVRHLYENTQCWERNDNRSYWWIIRSPILFAVLVNFIIFLRILHILVLKLRANQMRTSDRKYRLAKSTLTLIPLLGIHEAVFNLIPEESARGRLRYSKLGLELLLSSFHGLLVAVLYCICNKEVQAELRRKLHDTFRRSHSSCTSRSLHPPPGRPQVGEELMSDSSEAAQPMARTSQC